MLYHFADDPMRQFFPWMLSGFLEREPAQACLAIDLDQFGACSARFCAFVTCCVTILEIT